MPIRLVLATNHPRSIKALEYLLQQDPGIQIVARCQSDEETVDAVRLHHPDVVILHPRLSGQGGSEAGLGVLRQMRQAKLTPQVVLLTAPLPGDALLEAMRLGVGGIVLNEDVSHQLVSCIHKVYTGDRWLDSSTVGSAVETLVQRELAARNRAQSFGKTHAPSAMAPLHNDYD